MTNPGRLIALDYGTKRVGMAISDPLRMFAQPYGTFSPDETIEKIDSFNSESGVEAIVVGWPLLADGSGGKATQMVQEFVNRLKNRWPHIEVVLWDETYTSAIAREMLIETGASRSKRKSKGPVDRIAAAVLLQEYLDENS